MRYSKEYNAFIVPIKNISKEAILKFVKEGFKLWFDGEYGFLVIEKNY